MNVLVLSDIHGDTEQLQRILHQAEDEHDLILVLGDITDIGADDYVGAAEEVLSHLNQAGAFVKAVPGNMDDERILKLLIDQRLNLHRDLFSYGGYDFIGFGGGTTPFDTPFEPDDEERGQVLQALLERTKSAHRAIISHQPPKDTRIDRTSDGTQAGSLALRNLLERKDVDIVFSGHIHEAAGEDVVNETRVVNPGPVTDGKYALVTLGEEIDVRLKG